MGLFDRFLTRKKNRKKDFDPEESQSIHSSERKQTLSVDSKSGRIAQITDYCEVIIESMRQIEEAKAEYQLVTSYLTDMQKIDLIPKEQRENLEDAARKIINLNKERDKFQQKDTRITDKQYRLYERYEMQIPKELSVIKESERYQSNIQKDMEYLEKEKRNLLYEEEEIINRQSFLKGIAITTCVIVILLFSIFAALAGATEANLTIPFLLTVIMGMGSAFYIYMEARNNMNNIKLVELKQKREVMLMNKVKLKSVNNRNYLEYTYSKYMVDSYEELKTLWEEYVKLKDETRRYQSNTELLDFYNNQLIRELKKYGIADSEIWIYQPTAILDSKEMVEVRHRLNVRRQKLRERIDVNSKQKEEALKSVDFIIKSYPDCEEEAIRILRRYQIKQ